MLSLLLERIKHIGEIPLCNGIPHRAPHLFNYCFPLCYRCSAIVVSFLLTYYINMKYPRKRSIILLVLCLIPMIIDGMIQTFLGIESTNIRRVITGGLFGYGLGMLLSMLITKIYNY